MKWRCCVPLKTAKNALFSGVFSPLRERSQTGTNGQKMAFAVVKDNRLIYAEISLARGAQGQREKG
jgi:hypothetical protein